MNTAKNWVKRSLTKTEAAIVGQYEATHHHWSAKFALNINGTFARVGNQAEGFWQFNGKCLLLNWFDWPTERLVLTGLGRFTGDFNLSRELSAQSHSSVARNRSDELLPSYVPFLHRFDELNRNTTLVSLYMSNIPKAVLDLQLKVFEYFKLQLRQVLFDTTHGAALDRVVQAESTTDYIVVFDVDSIPLSKNCVPKLLFNVDFHGGVVGVGQKANHINTNHLYAGPSCCAFSIAHYHALKQPSFQETFNGDIGEELTWRSHEYGFPVCLLLPTYVEEPKWPLEKDLLFGLGTTYENEVYHAFETRISTRRFVSRCESILGYHVTP